MNALIITRGIVLLMIVSLLISGCEKFEDTILKVKVVDGSNNIELENIKVSVVKRKPGTFWGYETVGSFSSQTDAKGECVVVVNEYNPEKYEYLVQVNKWENDTPPDLGGYTYSQRNGPSLEDHDLTEVLVVNLYIIPLPVSE